MTEMASKTKINLVLDLDETLIHTIVQSNLVNYKYDNKHVLFEFEDRQQKYIVFARPHLFDFLREVSKDFNLYIYTFGVKMYADLVVSNICKRLTYNPFLKIYAREDFKYKQKILQDNYTNEFNTVIIDDNTQVWSPDQLNLIKINAFMGPECPFFEQDVELLEILKRLELVKNIYRKFSCIDIYSNFSEFIWEDLNSFNSTDNNKYCGIQDIDTDDELDLVDDESYIITSVN